MDRNDNEDGGVGRSGRKLRLAFVCYETRTDQSVRFVEMIGEKKRTVQSRAARGGRDGTVARQSDVLPPVYMDLCAINVR